MKGIFRKYKELHENIANSYISSLKFVRHTSITIFREEATSVSAGFHVGFLSWSYWNLEGCLSFFQVNVGFHNASIDDFMRKKDGKNKKAISRV